MSNRFPADDEHLHPYPGNLKHHKVEKEEQRKLLWEMMKYDAKSGLYNEKKRPPLLSNKASVEAIAFMAGMRKARELYEQARAKDAELIQMAVDMAHQRVTGVSEKMRELVYNKETLLLTMASAAGFKPTNQ